MAPQPGSRWWRPSWPAATWRSITWPTPPAPTSTGGWAGSRRPPAPTSERSHWRGRSRSADFSSGGSRKSRAVTPLSRADPAQLGIRRDVRPRELSDRPPSRRVGDQRRQPPLAGLLLLRADDPPHRHLPVPRWPGLEIGPCLPVPLELRLERGRQLRPLPLLVGVETGLGWGPRRVGQAAGRAHQALSRELLHPGQVHPAPGAALAARREANGVALVVDPPAHAVD